MNWLVVFPARPTRSTPSEGEVPYLIMANTIHINFVGAEGKVYTGEATTVFVSAAGGEIGIAPLRWNSLARPLSCARSRSSGNCERADRQPP